MKFIVDLWMDGYSSEEEMNAACKEFIKEQLDFTASSVRIEEYAASREIKSEMPSGKESNNMLRKYAGSDFSIRTRQHIKEGWRHCFKWMEKELTKRGIDG